MTSITMIIETKDTLIKPVKPSKTSGCVFVPKRYLHKKMCAVPIDYPKNISVQGTLDNPRYLVHSDVLFNKEVKQNGSMGCLFLPEEYTGYEMLVFEAP